MPEHSKEPWATTGGLKSIGWGIQDKLTIRDADEMPVAACVSQEVMDRIVACVNPCAGIPTEWLEKYGRRAFVREIRVIPSDKVSAIHEALSKPLGPTEKVVRIDTCRHCGSMLTKTEEDDADTRSS